VDEKKTEEGRSSAEMVESADFFGSQGTRPWPLTALDRFMGCHGKCSNFVLS
jgi:hypothetical protein